MGKRMKIRMKHLVSDRDERGNIRLYVRLPGRAKVRIRAEPGTPEFMEAYADAIADKIKTGKRGLRAKPGSFRHLCQCFYAGAKFKGDDISTQKWRRRSLDSICENDGDKPIALLEARHVRAIRNEKRETPAAANHRLKAMRAMFAWAVEEGEAKNDPTLGVKGLKYASNGHHTWTPDEIEQYQLRHPVGTQARLAFDLIRFTTGRREDAVRFGKQHVRNKRIRFRQAKNEHRAPIDIDIPLHPELEASIAATKTGNLTFLMTAYGKPFSPNGFGNKFKDWCRQADLPHCSAHGVRKATATELAENRATPHQIMSITGHQTLEEVERYTRAASKKRLATSAMRKLK